MAEMPQSSCATGTVSDGTLLTFFPVSTSRGVISARRTTRPDSPAARQLKLRMFDEPVIQTRLSERIGGSPVATGVPGAPDTAAQTAAISMLALMSTPGFA